MSLSASGVVGWTDLLLYNLIQAVHDCWVTNHCPIQDQTHFTSHFIYLTFLSLSHMLTALQCCPSLVLSQCQVFVSILDHVTCKFVAWSTIYPNTLNPKRTSGSLIFQTELLILREQRFLESHMLYNSHLFDGADSFNWTLYTEKSVVYCNV